MKLAIAATALMTLAACGTQGVQLDGVVEHEGVQVKYQTYWSRPDVNDIANHEQTRTARISIGGKTIALNPGLGCPKEWAQPSEVNFTQYAPDFWQKVADKFRALAVPKDQAEDHEMIVQMLDLLATAQLKAAPLGHQSVWAPLRGL